MTSQGRATENTLSTINNVDLDHFLGLLSEIDQSTYRATIAPLDRNQPEFYWIFRNCDFLQWDTGDASVLCVSGPAKCRLHQVSSNIVGLEIDATTDSQQSVLYFFCSTTALSSGEFSVTDFIHTLLRQFIDSLPSDQKKAIVVSAFLQTLRARTSSRFPWNHRGTDNFSELPLKTIIESSESDLWRALQAALDSEQDRAVTVIVDGFDQITEQRPGFVTGFCGFLSFLLKRKRKSKILLTSQSQAGINDLPHGLHIEYDEERKQFLNMLRFDNTRYDKIGAEYPSSCEWLWVHPQYLAWLSTNASSLLLVEGKPGSGKSTLAKYFERKIREKEPQSIVANFFYSFRDGESQTSHYSMLRSILYDVLNQNETFFFHFQPHFRAVGAHQPINVGVLYNALKAVLLSFKHHPAAENLYIIVDALDESDEQDRRDVMQLLHRLCSSNTTCTVKVFLSSRPISQLHKKCHTIRLQDHTEIDILKFTESFLGPELGFPPLVLQEALDYIVSSAQGTFVWVFLVRQQLLRFAESGYTTAEIFQFLKSLPTELADFYTLMLARLESSDLQNTKHRQKMFQLILYSYRPLSLTEVEHCFAVPDEIDIEFLPTTMSFQKDGVQDIKNRVISCGGGFLEVRGSTVQVIHQTVRQYLFNATDANSLFSISDRDAAHTGISVILIRYLMVCASEPFQSGEHIAIGSWLAENFDGYARYLNSRPLINYILHYLPQHLSECAHDATLIPQLQERLSISPPTSYMLEGWIFSNFKQKLPKQRQGLSPSDFRNNLLHSASRLAYPQVVETLLTAGADINSQNDRGQTAVHLAAGSGDDITVRLLLNSRADILALDKDGQTPLHLAADRGSDLVVALLVSAGANINQTRESDSGTALHNAVRGGYTNSVIVLIENGADVNAKLKSGPKDSMLDLAIMSGNEDVVKLMLDAGVEVHLQPPEHSDRGETGSQPPQRLTFESPTMDVEELVRQAGTNIWSAVKNGDLQMLKNLIEKCEDKDMQDLMGRTPLHFAMEQTPVHIEILKYLLQCKKININTQDFRGCTVLHLAVRRGNCALLQYLLSEEPDIELGDHQRQRSLEYAINAADPETVNLLLQNSADIRRICVEKWRSLYNATIDGILIRGDAEKRSYITKETLCENNIIGDVLGKAFEEYRYYYSTHDQNSVQSMDIFDHKQYLPPPDDNTSRADPATTPAYFMWVWRPGGNKQAYEGIPSTRSVNAAAPKAAFLRCYASFQYYVGHSYQDSDVDCRSSFEMTPQRSSISWIMLKGKRRDEQTSSPGARMEILSSRIYISTLSFGWIPDHGLEFFSLFLRDLKQKWCLLFDTAENHLASTREKLLEKQGMDNNLSHNLLRDAQCWTNLRKLILAHIRKAEEFIRVYEENDYLCDEVWNYINSLTLSDDLKGLKECTERISRLDEETKEMIQLEFNLVSIHESHISVEMAKKSTIMAASMKRLSWITFIFLPLMFTSSLFGMNVDLFNNHPSWRWYAVAGIVVQVLVTAGWVVFKFTKLEEALETAIREIYCRFINAIRKTSVDLLGGAHDRLNGER